MRIKFAVLVGVLAVGVASVACTPSASQTQPAVVGSSPAPEESVQPSPTVEASWFWASTDKEFPLFRSLAFVGNPGPRPLTGVELEWTVYDADNSIVGSYKSAIEDIPAGARVPYVAGSGGPNLSGVPARVELRVAESGSFVDTSTPAFGVADVTYKRSEFNLWKGAKNSYEITAKVTTGTDEVPSASIVGVVVLKDKSGAVVGADFWLPENLPETLAPNATFTMDFGPVVVTAKPASAEVSAASRL